MALLLDLGHQWQIRLESLVVILHLPPARGLRMSFLLKRVRVLDCLELYFDLRSLFLQVSSLLLGQIFKRVLAAKQRGNQLTTLTWNAVLRTVLVYCLFLHLAALDPR